MKVSSDISLLRERKGAPPLKKRTTPHAVARAHLGAIITKFPSVPLPSAFRRGTFLRRCLSLCRCVVSCCCAALTRLLVVPSLGAFAAVLPIPLSLLE